MTEFQRGLSAVLFLLVLSGLLMASAKAETGIASFYGGKHHGRLTASGERFNANAMTCAMRRRDWGVVVTVTVLATGRTARCRVNDYGPAKWTGRIIDVSHGMARALGFERAGLARVSVR